MSICQNIIFKKRKKKNSKNNGGIVVNVFFTNFCDKITFIFLTLPNLIFKITLSITGQNERGFVVRISTGFTAHAGKIGQRAKR